MELFKISHGPWEKIFEGKLEKTHVELYANPSSILLVLIFEGPESQAQGVVIEAFKAFSVEGEVENFIETLPREITLLLKHDKKQTYKFLMLGSSPNYTEWKEEPFAGEVDSTLKKLETASVLLYDIAKSYDINVQEMGKASLKVKKAFFTEPLLVPSIASNLTDESKTVTFVKGELNLGLTKERQAIIEPLELFLKSLVNGGEKGDRLHFLHILTESFLLAGTSAVVFDSTQSFRVLNSPTANISELSRYKITSAPIGFPTHSFRPIEQIKIDLNFISTLGFCEIFGIGKNAVNTILASALLKNDIFGIDDFVQKAKLTPVSDEINSYEIARTVRVLKLIGKKYPVLFDGKNEIQDIIASGVKTLGKAGIIDLSSTEPKIVFLIIHNILSSMLKQIRETEMEQRKKTLVVLPEIDTLLKMDLSPELTRDLKQTLKSLAETGVGIAISEDVEIDVPTEIIELVEAKVNVVQRNDVGVQLKGRKSYRVFLRPALSVCSEK